MEKHSKHSSRKELIVAASGFVLLCAVFAYGEYRTRTLRTEFQLSQAALQEQNESQRAKIAELDLLYAGLSEQFSSLIDALKSQESKSSEFEKKIGSISTTVDTLDKLRNTDKELLMKYSKTYFLNEHYVPFSLSNIGVEYLHGKTSPLQIHSSVWPHLKDMIEDAKEDGVDIKVVSAYRSFQRQAELKSAYTVTYGSGANRFSADQGYSEHQLGTTVDITTPSVGALVQSFDQTKAYEWLNDHAHEYGFVLSYPKNNAYYMYEPWHWRFVGVALATKLHEEDKHLYDLEQREVDAYLVTIFD